MTTDVVKFAVVVMSVLSVPCAAAVCEATSGAQTPHLVELYTSEGCSSCPPADRWLSRVGGDADVVALEFHVDYWDALGWPDPLARKQYTRRQERQAQLDHGHSVFTPQVVLDGRTWHDWYQSNRMPQRTESAFAASMTASLSASKLRIALRMQDNPNVDSAHYRTYFALTEDGLDSDIRAGENRGVHLRHDHVVRALVGPLPVATTETQLDVPREMNLNNAHVVAFIQNPDDGTVAQVLTLKPNQCAER